MSIRIHWRRLGLFMLFIVSAATVDGIVLSLLRIGHIVLLAGLGLGVVWGLVGTWLVGGSCVDWNNH